MNIDYYRNDSWVDSTFSKRGKFVLGLFSAAIVVGLIAAGCGVVQNMNNEEQAQQPVAAAPSPKAQNTAEIPADNDVDIEISAEPAKKGSGMVAYDIGSVGRADPFMPSDEIAAFDRARAEAYAEANAHNARIYEINKLKDVVIREADDISPYSFNLPVPPTNLASENSAAAKITRTKVVGIMYNQNNPSAIINVDDKDYLVRQGDKIMDQEYKVLKINQSWITVGLGSNVYSASIGELFSRDDLDRTRNDLYNLRNRFGGRKS